MWRHYNVLGKKQSREKDREEIAIHQILRSLKERLGEGGRFFKRITQSDIFIVVDDEEALQSKDFNEHGRFVLNRMLYKLTI